MSDFQDYLKIKSDPSAILWSGFSKAPDSERLKIHFQRLINQCVMRGGKILLYLKDESSGRVIGYDLMTEIDKETIESSGHSILTEYQGKGYGTILFAKLVEYARNLGYKKFTGWISENNTGSIKNVERNGFVRTKEYRVTRLEAFQRDDIFYKYECLL